MRTEHVTIAHMERTVERYIKTLKGVEVRIDIQADLHPFFPVQHLSSEYRKLSHAYSVAVEYFEKHKS